MKPHRNDPCPCGSGRKYKKCCGRPGAAAPDAAEARGLEPLLTEAHAQFVAGRYREALNAYQSILSQVPDHVDALHYAGLCHYRLGALEPAAAALSKALARTPDNAVLYNNLALVRQAQGDMEEAESLFGRAIEIDSHYVNARVNLGRLRLHQRRPEQALEPLQEAVRQAPDHADARAQLARAYAGVGHLNDALREFDHVRADMPADVRLSYAESLREWGHFDAAATEYGDLLKGCAGPMHQLARLEESRNQLDAAEAWNQRVLVLDPQHPGARLLRVRLLRRRGRLDEAAACLQATAPHGSTEEPIADYAFEQGMLLDRLGRYGEAFDAFRRCNQWILEHRGSDFDREAQQERARRMKTFFTRERMEVLSATPLSIADDDPRPVFVVGFPRSGTTLVEQIISAHPNICAGGELKYLPNLEATSRYWTGSEAFYPECLAALAEPGNEGRRSAMRRYYLEHAAELGLPEPGTTRFTDKLTLNESRLPLIQLLFPGAPVVHVIRHPLDSCLSAYFHRLSDVDFSFDLQELAHQYRLNFELAEHLREVVDVPYYWLHYEALLDEPEEQVRALLEFLGEPWDDRCLAFHENARVARTASYAQVTEKLYTRSRYRYRNYAGQLAEIVPILEPVMKKLGYTFEQP